MNKSARPSPLERITGNLGTQLGSTTFATACSLDAVGALTLTLPLLPILVQSLASGRQQARIEKALREMSDHLVANEQAVRDMTDAQYKLLNEVLLTAVQTTSDEKLQLLRSAAENTLADTTLQHVDAAVISRILRDISAEEVAFLSRAFQHDAVRLISTEEEKDDKVFCVQFSSAEARCAGGLIALGLLVSAGGRYLDLGQYRFSPMAAKLLAILRASR